MPDFKRIPPHELQRLTDAQLVDYVVAARDAGDGEAAREGVSYLAFAFEPAIKGWVRRTTPSQDVDDVAMEVMISVIKATFDGKVIGEFASFLKTICRRRVADYFRDRERHPDPEALSEEHEGDEDLWSNQQGTPDETEVVALMDAVARVLATRSPLHKEVIRLYGPGVAGFEDLPAAEVCAQIEADGSGDSMSVDNVAKIWSRFRKDLEEELDG